MRDSVPKDFNPPWWYIFFFSSYLSRRSLFRSIIKFSHEIKGRVLDFGCGSKPYESVFNSAEYIGVDIESSGHDHKTSRVDDYYDGSHLPYPDEWFDSIFTSEVFEHVPNLESIIAELNRVLKNNGSILITIPFAIHEHEAPYDFSRFTTYGITHILERNGFRIKTIEPTNNYLEAIFQLLIWYLTLSFNSKYRLLRILKAIMLIAPLNIMGAFLFTFLPRNNLFYSNLIILANKENIEKGTHEDS